MPSSDSSSVDTAIAPEAVARATAEVLEVPLEEIYSPSRERAVTTARHVAMFILCRGVGASLAEVGRHFNRQHSAVAHGVERTAELIEERPHLAATVELVAERLGVAMPRLSDPTGLVAVHQSVDTTLAFYGLFARARTLDLSYNTGRHLTDAYLADIALAVRNNGCRVRIVLTDPSSPAINDPELRYALCPGADDLSEDIEAAIDRVRDVATDLSMFDVRGGSFELRLRRSAPTCSIAVVDDNRALVTPFLSHMHSAEVLSFEWRRLPTGGPFLKYRHAFDRVWSEQREAVVAQKFSAGRSARSHTAAAVTPQVESG